MVRLRILRLGLHDLTALQSCVSLDSKTSALAHTRSLCGRYPPTGVTLGSLGPCPVSSFGTSAECPFVYNLRLFIAIHPLRYARFLILWLSTPPRFNLEEVKSGFVPPKLGGLVPHLGPLLGVWGTPCHRRRGTLPLVHVAGQRDRHCMYLGGIAPCRGNPYLDALGLWTLSGVHLGSHLGVQTLWI